MVSKVFAALGLASAVSAAAIRSGNITCTPETIKTRIEWTNMATADKHSYLEAVQCLMKLPGQTGINGTVTRFDDMNAMHQVQAKEVHLTAQFLPFHRLYLHVYELLLREECGYQGPTPWWDETRDAGNFKGSSLLNPDTGFGGDGTGPDGCVTDGPFANTTLHVGPGQDVRDHCLSRKISEFNSTLANETYIQQGNDQTTYLDYWQLTGFTTHGAGHSGIGGVMEDIDASPGGKLISSTAFGPRPTSPTTSSVPGSPANHKLTSSSDPLFYIHHAFVDRAWWKWQSAKPCERLYQLGGPSKQQSFEGEEIPETTLDHVLTLYGIRPNATVRDVMDIKGGFLCYDYDY